MADINLINISKSFKDIEAVRDFSLEVKDGEFVCVLGPPGSGKTTLLKIIAGLITPDKGEIYIGGTLMNEIPPHKRSVAMVFESLALYPNRTAYENIAAPLKVQKMPKDEIEERVVKVARMLGIEHLLDRKPATHSGGERQRVALARAYVKGSQVLLLDEPLSQLDALFRLEMRVELKRLQRELGQTSIFVTHDQVEAMSMADRIAVMKDGKLQQYDTPDEIYNHPANVIVARHTGSPPMNFIRCYFKEKNGKAFLDAEAFTLDISNLKEIVQKQGISELILGARPEDIIMTKKPVGEELIEAEVYEFEPLGLKTIINLKVGKNVLKTTSMYSFEAGIGEKIWIKFDKNKIHLFNEKTGEAII